ncbi:uncharacterized protein [Musca autumnalis]|uniref:uncharacterized protein n=1 Tax=Musca autumnalis TaxID=221902 RepID=UPI003CF30DE1
MAEAMMCHYQYNSWTMDYSRATKTYLHAILQLFGGGCGIASCLVICIELDFTLGHLHGRLGFAAFILCCISFISGFLAFFSKYFKVCVSPLLNKTVHNVLGIVTFALGQCTQYYGYQFAFYLKKPWDLLILLQVITLIILVLACWGPLKSLSHKYVSLAS